ncbi:MAG: class I SAM-dependent methyltransferase [Clostridia bacterium]|nr:class I SAM-dependent methyltransferase [Clostridia bacterium]
MKADYRNWVPKSMVTVPPVLTAVSVVLLILTQQITAVRLRAFCFIFLSMLTLVSGACSFMFISWYQAFSYKGRRKLSKHIIEGIADFIKVPEGGHALDIGCGSGALTIACAKKNPKAQITGVDRWGKNYRSFSKKLCEKNAEAEGVKNVTFQKGDAKKLDFPDESFDCVLSNYVYHNIVGADKQALLRETLRVLKKGGTFAIHDLMSPIRCGDMQKFVGELKNEGYEKVELINTANGMFMTKREAKRLFLESSTLLTGIK